MSKVDRALGLSNKSLALESVSIEDLDSIIENKSNVSLDDLDAIIESTKNDLDLSHFEDSELSTSYDFEQEETESDFQDISSSFMIEDTDNSDEQDTSIENSDIDFGVNDTSMDEQEINFDEEDEDISSKADERGSVVSADELIQAPEGVSENQVIERSLSDDSWGKMVTVTGDFVVQETGGENFQLIYVDIKNITVIKRIRNSETDVASLIRSIRSTGLLEPIVVAPLVTDGQYLLIHGYRRIVASARAGLRKIPCIVNNKIKTTDIQVLEAMYNHHRNYSIQEQIDYIEYLEREKGILSASMIEFLLQMNSGDYAKLKDLLNDGDPDILGKLLSGAFTIDQAFKKLEARRKKETKAEQEAQKAEKVYGDDSVQENLQSKGQEASAEDISLSDEEISAIAVKADQIDDGIEEASLEEMVSRADELDGFEVKHQEAGNREPLSREKRKAIIARDKGVCQCCKNNGENNPEEWADVLDVHHIIPVFLDTQGSTDGGDRDSNLITVCFNCHKRIHLFSYGDLTISRAKTEEEIEKLSEEERIIYKRQRDTLKRIVRLGEVIRKGMQTKKIKKEQAKKDHPIHRIGRNMPGKGTQNPDV